MSNPSSSDRAQLQLGLQVLAIAGASFLFVGSLLGNMPLRVGAGVGQRPVQCAQAGQPGNTLSRQQLAEILTFHAQQNRDTIQSRLGAPFCQTTPIHSHLGEPVMGEAYPLAFDPQTWIVLLYRDDLYVGYEFEFR